jgi:integral membrane sensor domain MASE1
MKACKAPYRNAGPMTRSVNIALIVIATICVAIRFIARWRIQDSNIGWDDWTILASYLLLIPSTVILQISSLTVPSLTLLYRSC